MPAGGEGGIIVCSHDSIIGPTCVRVIRFHGHTQRANLNLPGDLLLVMSPPNVICAPLPTLCVCIVVEMYRHAKMCVPIAADENIGTKIELSARTVRTIEHTHAHARHTIGGHVCVRPEIVIGLSKLLLLLLC